MKPAIIAMGASWGGLSAVTTVLSGLPWDFPVPIVLVQHRSRHAENLLAPLLQEATQLRVVDVEDKEPIEPQSVYVAPANYHLLVEKDHLSLTTDPLVRHSRPSIDVMFTSAADAFRARTVGVVLTGANDDGSRGLRRIVDLGGRALVQDPDTADSRTMPVAALRSVPEAEVAQLDDIASRLVTMIGSKSKAKLGQSQ
ncbi:MAG TPA: chemotaxis protein CheB [Gemmatimonadaceae bacterium]